MSYHWRKKEKHYWGRTSAGHLKMTENSTTLEIARASFRGFSDFGWCYKNLLDIPCIEKLFLCQT